MSSINSLLPSSDNAIYPLNTLGGLPTELLAKILNLAAETNPWTEAVNYAQISTHFRDTCVQHVTRYNLWIFLKRLKISDASTTATQPVKTVKVFPENALKENTRACKKTAAGEWRYLCPFRIPLSLLHILFSSKKGFEFTSLDIKEIIETKFADKLTEHHLNTKGWSAIVDCHPTDQGFILITQGGVSIFNYNASNQPECIAFFSPFGPLQSYSEQQSKIQYSTYHQGMLYLQCYNMGLLYEIDLRQPHPQFVILSNRTLFQDNLVMHLPNGDLCLIKSQNVTSSIPTTYYKKMTKVSQQLVELGTELRFLGEFKSVNLFPIMDKWMIHPAAHGQGEDYIFILNYDGTAVWIGKEMRLKRPNCQDNEQLFQVDDLLFLTYKNKKFRVIHIPTKTDFTKQLAPFIEPYLNDDTRLYGARFDKNQENNFQLQILLLNKESTGGFALKSYDIPLSSALQDTPSSTFSPAVKPPSHSLKPTARIPANPPQNPMTTKNPSPPQSPVLQNTKPNNLNAPAPSRPPSVLDKKIILIAGSVLLVLTLAASTALLFLHPGQVVWQNHQITVSLPTMITFFAGGVCSFLFLSIGIYRTCK